MLQAGGPLPVHVATAAAPAMLRLRPSHGACASYWSGRQACPLLQGKPSHLPEVLMHEMSAAVPLPAIPPPPQVVLTGEPALVAAACTLLLTVLRHNAGKGLRGLPRVLPGWALLNSGHAHGLPAGCGSGSGWAEPSLVHARSFTITATSLAPPSFSHRLPMQTRWLCCTALACPSSCWLTVAATCGKPPACSRWGCEGAEGLRRRQRPPHKGWAVGRVRRAADRLDLIARSLLLV